MTKLIGSITVTMPIDEVEKRLKTAVTSQELLLAARHDLKETLVQKGPYIKGEYVAFEIGYVGPIKEIFEAYPNIVTLLPGRVCAWEHDGKTTLTFLRPGALAQSAPIPAKHRKLVKNACKDFEHRLERVLSQLER